jgi:hypothetical protein
MTTLHLLKNEHATFARLPQDITGAYDVAVETSAYSDSIEEQSLRMCLVHFPGLQGYKSATSKAASLKDLSESLQSSDLDKLSDDEIHDLLFVLGPDFLTKAIHEVLLSAKTTQDIAGLASLCTLRHFQMRELSAISK